MADGTPTSDGKNRFESPKLPNSVELCKMMAIMPFKVISRSMIFVPIESFYMTSC